MGSVKFYKYHGCGNDFVLIEDYTNSFLSNYRNKIESICKRHYGIGADGILLIQSSNLADVKMRIFNSDGAEAKMCGNGLRCVAKHLGKSCAIETTSGICIAELHGELVRASLPSAKVIQSPLSLPMDMEGHLIYSGTEHLVIFVDDISTDDFLPLAQLYRQHEMFQPYGVNVNFAQIESSDLLLFRTFEKGVEQETKSCGTGGAAIAIACNHLHKQNRVRTISSQNEELVFSFDTNRTLWMIGPAALVFEGVLVPKKT